MEQHLTDNELIERYSKELKLSSIRDRMEDMLAEAAAGQWDYRMFLKTVLQREVEQRYENRKYARIRKADFPQLKYLHELVRDDLPPEGRDFLPHAETLNFIKEGRNIVMYGNPGTGKTHIAIALGIKACMEGCSVYFTTVPHLLTKIREAKSGKTLQSLEGRFKKFDLVICDEMGYVGFDKESADMLFNMLSLRTGTRSIIVTTNLPFTRWEEIMKDKVLCSALVDRLCHKAHLVNMTGKSYRIRETQKMYEDLF